jgi:hypothetical protein
MLRQQSLRPKLGLQWLRFEAKGISIHRRSAMLRLVVKASAFALIAACLALGQGSTSTSRSSASFVGRWEVSTGAGGQTFYITLERGGEATKSHGSPNGKWTVYGDEARITWDDGWHDVIRKAGNHYEKAAYAPGKSFSDQPDNITGATRTEPL